MSKENIVERNLNGLLDSWNDEHPGEAMEPRIVQLIEQHLEYCYVMAIEEVLKYLNEKMPNIPKKKGQVSASAVYDLLRFFKE